MKNAGDIYRAEIYFDPALEALIQRLESLEASGIDLHITDVPPAKAPAETLAVLQLEWERTARAVLYRNEPGMELYHEDVDPHWRGLPQPDSRPLMWVNVANEAGTLSGTAPAARFAHENDMRYIGVTDDGLPLFQYAALRTPADPAIGITVLRGFAILLADGRLATVVYDNDGTAKDLPKRFREVSIWEARPALG